jgi:Asp-tRNA(Asn)/Glu-tRNA(Gln) amidotransferase A subunit family amidase
VADLAKALTVMASIGFDPKDNITALIPSTSVGVDYSKSLHGGSLKGVRFGLLTGLFNRTAGNETTPVNDVMDAMVQTLTKAGATVVTVNSTVYNSTAISAALDVQAFEYRQLMDAYLQNPTTGGSHPSTLTQLYLNSSGKFLVIPSQYAFVNKSLMSSTDDPNYAVAKLGITNLSITVSSTFASSKLDAFIYPEQQNLVVKIGSPRQMGRNGILAAVTGSPVVVVPAGFSSSSADAPIGVPIGMEIMGLPWSETKLLNIAAAIEKVAPIRKPPASASMSVLPLPSTVPIIVPNKGNIPAAYPVGKLSP